MIHTNIIAKVERFQDGIADLEPLFLDDDGQPYEKIVNARVLSQRFKIPKRIILEGGQVNHSNIHDSSSHTINNGYQIISIDTESDTEEIEIFPHYEKGDIVTVAIIERDFSDAIEGKRGNGGSVASHELTSAVIVGKVVM